MPKTDDSNPRFVLTSRHDYVIIIYIVVLCVFVAGGLLLAVRDPHRGPWQWFFIVLCIFLGVYCIPVLLYRLLRPFPLLVVTANALIIRDAALAGALKRWDVPLAQIRYVRVGVRSTRKPRVSWSTVEICLDREGRIGANTYWCRKGKDPAVFYISQEVWHGGIAAEDICAQVTAAIDAWRNNAGGEGRGDDRAAEQQHDRG